MPPKPALTSFIFYSPLQRYRICGFHASLPEMQTESGELQRFCQQCGRFQPLEDFDELKKTCRRKLNMHNAQRKRKRDQIQQHRQQRNHPGTSRAISEQPGTPFQSALSPNSARKTTRIKPRLAPKEEQPKPCANLCSSGPASGTDIPASASPVTLDANLLDGINIDELFLALENNRVEYAGGSNVSESLDVASMVLPPVVELPDRLPSMQLTSDYGRFSATTWVPSASRELSFSESSELCNASLSLFDAVPADLPRDVRNALQAFNDPGNKSATINCLKL